MSNIVSLSTDAEKIFKQAYDTHIKTIKPIVRSILRKTLNKHIVKPSRNTLKRQLKIGKRSKKYIDTLPQGVRLSKLRIKKGVFEIPARITSNGKKGSGSYRLKFFEEAGTARYTKKGKYYRGIITKGKSFFSNAISSNENAFETELMNELEKNLKL